MDPSPSRRRRLIPLWLSPVLVVALLVGAAALVLARTSTGSEHARVPNVAGLDLAIAGNRLAAAGFALVQGDTRFSATVPRGSVIGQTPAPGTPLPPGASVTVAVSAGSERFALPDVVGRQLAEALSALSGAGLGVQTERASSDEPSGTVIASIPSPGQQVTTSDIVRLTVSSGMPGGDALVPFAFDGTSIVLDPAPVAEGTADAPLAVARRLQALLTASGALVTVTRSALTTSSADEARAQRAVDASPAVIVGLSVTDRDPSGIVLRAGGGGPSGASSSAQLVQAVSEAFGRTAAVAKPAPDPVLESADVPGMRILLGSASTPADAAAFRDPAWIDRVASLIYRGIGSFVEGTER